MDSSELFVDKSRRLLTRDYLPKLMKCVALLTEEQIWFRSNSASNSVGNLILHLEGNVRQWILTGIGGLPDTRIRQLEFDENGPIAREALLGKLTETISAADVVIGGLESRTLLEERVFQGKNRTVLEAIYHVVEHFSMHTGQIVQITKILAGRDLGLNTDIGKTAEPAFTGSSSQIAE